MKRFSDEQHVLMLEKAEHKYVFVFGNSDEQVKTILRRFGQYAADPNLNFSWFDAAQMAQRVRKETQHGRV